MILTGIAIILFVFFAGYVTCLKRIGLSEGRSKVLKMGSTESVRMYYKDKRGEMTKIGKWQVVYISEEGFALNRVEEPEFEEIGELE